MAALAASGVRAATPGGGDAKCDSGSATPKYTSPMPMPAANSIENQAPLLNSGSSSSAPSFMSP